MLLQPGVPSIGWGSVVRQLAAGLGSTRRGFEGRCTSASLRPRTLTSPAGNIAKGTSGGALRFEVIGLVDGAPAVVLEHVTRLRGRPVPAPAATRHRRAATTVSRSPASPATPSTSACPARTATTTTPGAGHRHAHRQRDSCRHRRARWHLHHHRPAPDHRQGVVRCGLRQIARGLEGLVCRP